MPSRLASNTRRLIERCFPERQIFYRRRGEVVFLRLRKSLQLAISVLVLAAGAWVAYAVANLIMIDRIIAAKDRRIVEVASAYRSLGEELASAQARFLGITEELEAKHQQLLELVNQRSVLEKRLSETRRQLDGLVAERDELLTMTGALGERITKLDHRLQGALADPKGSQGLMAEQPAGALSHEGSDEAQLGESLATVDLRLGGLIAERDRAVRDGGRMVTQVQELEHRLAELDGVEAHLDDVIFDRDLAIQKAGQMASRVAELEIRLSVLKKSQGELIARVQERTKINLGEIEAMIARTGLSVDELLKDAAPATSGLGGPFVGLSDDTVLALEMMEFADLGGSFEFSVLKLEHQLKRWTGLQNLLQRLPLASPMDTYYIASPYGKRRDPFSKKWAMHSGVDLAGSLKAPVWSTAPGKVIFVGRKGPYGKTVEIDHGYGLKTRYGHLSKILVNNGDAVGFRHKIGVMGNTGRSTGSHLHYEVVFDGSRQDPAKFMKAGKYVFKD